ncbi:MAG: PDZ domain-containing protein [Caldilinea sp. CFX5]|nr:PDZ domain-containing protein [Caldilinea sp. CFX5]
MTKAKWQQLLTMLFLSAVWFGIGWQAHANVTPAALPPEVARIAKAGQLILTRAYPSPAFQADELADAAIRGMLRFTEDRYAALYTGPAQERYAVDFAGETGAPGLWYNYQDGDFVISALRPRGPAETAGVQIGDIIRTVDGLTVNELTSGHEIAMMLRGPIGTAVPLTVQRGDATLTLSVPREEREQLRSRLFANGVGYVRLPSFPTGVAQPLKSELTALQAQGMTALLLDMRNNAGGSTLDAAAILNFFIRSGDLYTAELKGGQRRTTRADGTAFLADLPLTVLVDGGSFSSTELFVAALQDHHRATIIGATTGGKGTIQDTIALDDHALLHLTIAKWLSPAGHWLYHKGVQPDVTIVDDPTTPNDEVLDLALEQVQGDSGH